MYFFGGQGYEHAARPRSGEQRELLIERGLARKAYFQEPGHIPHDVFKRHAAGLATQTPRPIRQICTAEIAKIFQE